MIEGVARDAAGEMAGEVRGEASRKCRGQKEKF